MERIFFYDPSVLHDHYFYRISSTFWFAPTPSPARSKDISVANARVHERIGAAEIAVKLAHAHRICVPRHIPHICRVRHATHHTLPC